MISSRTLSALPQAGHLNVKYIHPLQRTTPSSGHHIMDVDPGASVLGLG
jgi:hypothetical protein